MILGAHVSAQGGVHNAPLNAKELGINAIQIFSKNQRQWNAKPLDGKVTEQYHERAKEARITHAVSHVSYLINMCAPDPEKRTKSINAMVDELERAEALDLSHVIVHPGSHLKEGEEWGISEISHSLNEIHRRTEGFVAKVTLEITAGQGTNLGYSFEQLAKMIEGTKEQERLAICYDTCHGHAAGYDLRDESSYEAVWQQFDEIIGIERLQTFHFNDTKHPLGSRKDRHERIGEGDIGLDAFRFLLNDPRFDSIPAFLETPEDERGGYEVDLEVLCSLLP